MGDRFCYYCLVEASAEAHADVAELVDALDLGSSFSRSEGSSPFIRMLYRSETPDRL